MTTEARSLHRKLAHPIRDCAFVRCGKPFQPRVGGRPQRFCSPPCAWRASNAKRYASHRVPVLIRQRELMYGLSAGGYEALRTAQGGLCAICGQPESSFRGDRLRSLSVDHDHITGELRGLLCNRCNRGLGNFGDDADLLTRAARYLTASQEEATA